MKFENGGFPDSGVLIDTFEEPPSLGLNVDEEATICKLKQRIKDGIFKEVTMDNTDCKKFVDITKIDITKQVKFVDAGDGSWVSKFGSTVSAGGYSAFFENKSCWDVFDILRKKGIIKNLQQIDYPAVVKFIKSCSVYYEDVIENEIGLFRVGDEVITSDGRKGKIVDICHCENCRRRGFYEPKVLYEDEKVEDITKTDKELNFCDFYKIGDVIFGNADIAKIDFDISLYDGMITVLKDRRQTLLEAMSNDKE